jgi:hypothetical protein
MLADHNLALIFCRQLAHLLTVLRRNEMRKLCHARSSCNFADLLRISQKMPRYFGSRTASANRISGCFISELPHYVVANCGQFRCDFAVATALRRPAAEQPARNASHSEATTKHIAPKKVGRTRAPCQVAAPTATQIYVALPLCGAG